MAKVTNDNNMLVYKHIAIENVDDSVYSLTPVLS